MYKNISKLLILIGFFIVSFNLQSQSFYYYQNGFETFLNNSNYVLFHQHVSENYLWHPRINSINEFNSVEKKEGIDFNLHVGSLLSSQNTSFNIMPSISYKGFSLSIKQPYNLWHSNDWNKFSDMRITTDYTVKVGKFYNNLSASLNIPLGQDFQMLSDHYMIWDYGMGVNGSASYDFIYSDKFSYNMENYGFYGNLFFRHSLGNYRKYEIRNYENELLQTNEYQYQHGNITSLTLGGYVATLKNLHIHYGLGFLVNSNNKYDLTITNPDGSSNMERVIEGEQALFYGDFRLGLTTRIKSADFSLFIFNSNREISYNSYGSNRLNVFFNICWHVF
jgi:hypothetical protein